MVMGTRDGQASTFIQGRHRRRRAADDSERALLVRACCAVRPRVTPYIARDGVARRRPSAHPAVHAAPRHRVASRRGTFPPRSSPDLARRGALTVAGQLPSQPST